MDFRQTGKNMLSTVLGKEKNINIFLSYEDALKNVVRSGNKIWKFIMKDLTML